MRVKVILIALILGVSMLPSSQAGSPENLEDVGWVFGGVYLDANESGNSTSSLSELPAIVEDYTATWCTNCVTVEDALNDIAENNNMKTYIGLGVFLILTVIFLWSLYMKGTPVVF